MTTLSVRLIEVNDRRAKAAIYGLNQTGRRPHELEEAWIVRALVREDGLSQTEVAELLGRHKSWVCRRLALLEKLGTDVRQDLEVGLLSATAAREIARLPAGNQSEVVDVARREGLSGEELRGVVRLLLEATTAEQKMFVLTKPRSALGHAEAPELHLARVNDQETENVHRTMPDIVELLLLDRARDAAPDRAPFQNQSCRFSATHGRKTPDHLVFHCQLNIRCEFRADFLSEDTRPSMVQQFRCSPHRASFQPSRLEQLQLSRQCALLPQHMNRQPLSSHPLVLRR